MRLLQSMNSKLRDVNPLNFKYGILLCTSCANVNFDSAISDPFKYFL